MKKLIKICLLLVLIIFIQNSYAQKPDTAKGIAIRYEDHMPTGPQPLYIVDGVIYKGAISSINPNDVRSIDILKGDSAVALYGSAAENGVAFIKLKHSLSDSLHKANAGEKVTSDAAVKQESLYVIDGIPISDTEFKKLNPADIFEITLLRDSTRAALYGRNTDDIMLITTKKQAQKLYQAKLSAFSSKYKSYMEKHADDSNLLYVLNNTMLQIDKKRLRELYDLKPADIKKIEFKTDSHFKTDATVIITTNE